MTSINLKYMNNKSRKGLYYYIKAKGIRGQYYKADEHNIIQVDDVVEYYNRKYVKKEKIKYHKTFESHKKTTKEKIKEATSKKTISSQIEKGRSEATIKNVQDASKKRINNATEKLLQKSIRNPETRKKLAKHEQQKKYKEYITHYITFYDKENNKLLKAKAFNITTHELTNKLQKASLTEEHYDKADPYKKLLKKLRYANLKAIQGEQSGMIHHYNVKIMLRK